MKLELLLRALKHRNYRLFFSGQIVSLTGTWIRQIALSWLIYRLTGSAFILGVVGFANQIPAFLISPFAGVLIDRWNKHRVIIATQVLLMLVTGVLTVLVFADLIQVWHVIVLNLFSGAVNGFDMPARQAFIVDIVEDKADLSNAIALNSSVFNSARLIGPSVAGLLIAAVGEGMCFLIDTVSYAAVITALFFMRISYVQKQTRTVNVLTELKEGVKYAFGFLPIRSLLLLIALLSMVGMPYTILMPVFASKIFNGGANTLGFLMGSVGVGALMGALYLASRKTVLGLGKVITFAAIVFGAGLIIFSLSTNLIFSMIMLVFTGASMMMQMASSNTILQTIAPDEMRGRVMSFYIMSFMGMATFGSLFAGTIADTIGAPNTLIIGGICCIIGGAVFGSRLKYLRKIVLPIYQKIGIIPEIAKGIQSASNLTSPPENG